MGSIVKVNAICAQTGVEVTIQGPASAGQDALKRTAVQKLNYMKSKKTS